MRSNASSRVRWPTMIENVLKIVNAPTNSEMKAKTSSAVEKNDSAWSIDAGLLVDHGLTGDDLDAVRQDLRDGALDLGLVGARCGRRR